MKLIKTVFTSKKFTFNVKNYVQIILGFVIH